MSFYFLLALLLKLISLLKDHVARGDEESSDQGHCDEEDVKFITEDGFVFHLEMYHEGRYVGWVETREGPLKSSFKPEEFTHFFFQDG